MAPSWAALAPSCAVLCASLLQKSLPRSLQEASKTLPKTRSNIDLNLTPFEAHARKNKRNSKKNCLGKWAGSALKLKYLAHWMHTWKYSERQHRTLIALEHLEQSCACAILLLSSNVFAPSWGVLALRSHRSLRSITSCARSAMLTVLHRLVLSWRGLGAILARLGAI